MIKKQTYIFLVFAILTSVPAVNEMFKNRPVCVQDTRLQSPARLLRVQTGPARMLRVQDSAYDPDEPKSPCPSTGYGAFLKVITFTSACLWICFVGLLTSDIKQGRRRRRRHHRSPRRRSSSASPTQESRQDHGQAD